MIPRHGESHLECGSLLPLSWLVFGASRATKQAAEYSVAPRASSWLPKRRQAAGLHIPDFDLAVNVCSMKLTAPCELCTIE